jgi:hypothetical protein
VVSEAAEVFCLARADFERIVGDEQVGINPIAFEKQLHRVSS